jgi:hypothetical protein
MEADDISDDEMMMPHEREMRDALRQVVMLMDQQAQMLAVIAQRLNAPKRVVRDPQTNRVVGVESLQ